VRLFPACFAITLAVAMHPGTTGAQRTWHPTITGNSPNELRHGEPITITGTDLSPPGWRRQLRFRPKYALTSATHILNLYGSDTRFTIDADRNMRGDSVWIEWVVSVDSVAAKNPIPASERVRHLPATFIVHAPPDLMFGGDVIAPDVGQRFSLMTIVNGMGVVKGRWLRDLRFSGSFAGEPLRGLSMSYEPRGSTTRVDACCEGGADRAVFIPPTQKTSGWLMIEHAMGRDSMAVTFAFPPAPSQVVQQTPTGTTALAPSNTLLRGKTYVIRGQHLSISHMVDGITSIKRGMAQLGGLAIAPVFASDTNIVFTVPATFSSTSATLGVVTPRGTATLGTFTVASPSLPLNVTGISSLSRSGLENTVLTPGRSVELLAAVDIPVGSKDHEWGNLIVTQTGGPPGAVRLPARPVPVTGPSTVVKISGGDVQASTPVAITIAHESNGLNGTTTQTRQRSFTVRPPHPIRVEGNDVVTAGATHQFTVRFDSATTTTSSIFVLLSSTNPNVAAVPTSATLAGDRAVFSVTVPPTFQAGGTTTLSATLDGATASLPVTVQLPQIQQLTLYEGRTTVLTSALAGSAFRAEARFNGRLVSNANVMIESVDTSLTRASNTPNGLSSDGLTFTQYFFVGAGLSQPRSVTLTARYVDSRTATLSLIPYVISTFTATPTSGPGGSTITATAIFSSPLPMDRWVIFASADTMRATVSPASSQATGGTTSKVVSILLKGPVTSPRQVPITATLRVGSPAGTIVSTQTILVTVNP
jgi:hypothetical protein